MSEAIKQAQAALLDKFIENGPAYAAPHIEEFTKIVLNDTYTNVIDKAINKSNDTLAEARRNALDDAIKAVEDEKERIGDGLDLSVARVAVIMVYDNVLSLLRGLR
jgi:hypothetical protein